MQIKDAFALIQDDIKLVEESFDENLMTEVFHISKVGKHILTSGGKRFRPLILLLASRMTGYAGDKHIPLAIVMEFIHTATLLHDDVVDSAGLRRGTPSANALWGNESSVLVGDYLLSKAFSIAIDCGSLKILKLLAEATTLMAEGEVLQMIKHSDMQTTEEDYLTVITNKTAALFSISAAIPAILADLTHEKEEALATYGMDLGIAFQLMDDCLDYTSKDDVLGKTVGSDLREGKITLPLIKAYREATQAEKATIDEAVNSDGTSEAGLKEVFDIIKKHDGIGYTLELAKERIARAKECLELFAPSVEREALTAVVDYVIDREN